MRFRFLVMGLAAATTPLALATCGDDSAGGDFMDEDVPGGDDCDTDAFCGTDGTGESGDTVGTGDSDNAGEGGLPDDACRNSAECGPDLLCTAPFDGNRGPYTCEPTCISNMDETMWCADATACCDPTASCTTRGYCQPGDGGGTGTSGTGTSGTVTSGTGTSGTDTGTSGTD